MSEGNARLAVGLSASSRGATAKLALFILLLYLAGEHSLTWSQATMQGPEDATRQVAEGALLRRVSLVLLGAYGTLVLLRRDLDAFRFHGVLSLLVTLYLGWAFLSVAWADDRALTARRLFLLATLCAGAAAFAREFSWDGLRRFAVLNSGAILLVGIVAEAATGRMHLGDPTYRFSGTMHPNLQGINCILLFVGSLASLRASRDRRRQWLWAGAMAVAMVFLLLTKSRTSLAAALLGPMLGWFWQPAIGRKIALALAGLLAAWILLNVWDARLSSRASDALQIGRTAAEPGLDTFSNRVPLWQECLRYVALRPLAGYGYAGFWDEDHILEISDSQNWDVGITSAHNQYLSICLGLGLIGGALFAAILGLGWWRTTFWGSPTQREATWMASLLLGALMINMMMEDWIETPNPAAFVVYVIIAKLAFFPGRQAVSLVRVTNVGPASGTAR